jgi:uncharacterized damage-inducible protein DinB
MTLRTMTLRYHRSMKVTTIQSFLDYFNKVRERTMRLVACIPPDKIEWRAAPGKFTLGDLARHIAVTERNVFTECACGGHNRYAGCGPELAQGRDEVVKFMERMHAESLTLLSQLTDSQLQQKCRTADGSSITTWKFLRSMLEHEIHHRGELYAYLGLLGVTVPPLYGLTSEQVREIATRTRNVADLAEPAKDH